MKILVVEDDPRLREAIVDTLMLKKYDVIEAKNGKEAVVLLQENQPDLILTDINMPEMTGLELLTYVKQEHPWLPVLLMTAYGDVSQAVQAMQQGADDYLMKPFELRELDELLKPYTQNGEDAGGDDEPVCEAAVSQQLFQLAKRVAQTDSTVLISGESGTGKEVLARYIHQNSQRKKAPFIAINCAAIPENMLEAMLFGYEKGAFTGAYQTMPGKFEQADGGTLLLDEITEMDPALQAKLLRVLYPVPARCQASCGPAISARRRCSYAAPDASFFRHDASADDAPVAEYRHDVHAVAAISGGIRSGGNKGLRGNCLRRRNPPVRGW